ncbi:polysaccharide pyruvyl transferase family protein [Chrysosporum bergii ANA360D]|uniref:Polysaccharide pyruvyl transferase family protein n=1 Tax=Chrysosporum bergii ANA360D TaxID=617107 RepID=A0AA43GRV8_9CYAN|nr:polysaccharide pyruvyl transferase family protein [Chrysosporum bergii]MDH6060532.1 polysaccharide pyruvyl transferase family protein [Chrysosporum bergii ANA360D]
MKILMMGYYGCHNIGDDIFVYQLTKFWQSKQVIDKVFVLCQDDYYQSTSEKIEFFSNQLTKLQKLWLMLRSDYIIWGGGTLNFSSRPKNLIRMQNFAKFMGKSFVFLGVGLETVKPETEKNLAKIFENADFLYVRDNQSDKFVQQTLKYTKPFHLGGDLAFLDLSMYDKYLTNPSKSNNIDHISFSGKFWWGEGRAKFYAQQLTPLIEKFNSVIHLLPAHQGQERSDNKFHELLKKYLPEDNCQIHSWDQPENFVEILSQMDFHLGNRLHSVIIADILGVPNIGIGDYPSKISNYIEKTEILPQSRIAAFMEPISLERIEHIYHQYQRPDQFILKESKTSREGLEKLLQSHD